MEKQNAVKKLAGVMFIFWAVLTAIFIWCRFYVHEEMQYQNQNGDTLVALNEISQMIQSDNTAAAAEKTALLSKQIGQQAQSGRTHIQASLFVLYAGSVMMLAVIFGYIFRVIIIPFQRMEAFAGQVAAGNLDIAIPYERTNIFGKFTWAFDHMRREIIKARAGEKEAIENNKTVIATLSHDIKTPIASIRAYAEGLEANMDATAERRQRYIEVIMRKCDAVTTLTNDLFLHALSDLDKLKICATEVSMKLFLLHTFSEYQMSAAAKEAETSQLQIGMICEGTVYADEKRLIQVLENVMNNAAKYAPDSVVQIETAVYETGEKAGMYEIAIQDFGGGIPAQDIPFVCDKFYRGSNVQSEQGAGLGLYIVAYVLKKMDGRLNLINKNGGLRVEILLPLHNTAMVV